MEMNDERSARILRKIGLKEVEDIALGASLLGAGGGGDPYYGKLMAIGAIKAFRENGLRVPEDISVTGFDDDGRAKEFDLTTVEIPNYERGYIAAQYLLANIEGAADYGTCKISTRVKWRSTVR